MPVRLTIVLAEPSSLQAIELHVLALGCDV